MKFPDDYQEGVLIKRYKRFLADVELPSGEVVTVHCPNTGAMTGCAEPGSRVWLASSISKSAKYAWGWRWVETRHGLANIYSAGANRLFYEAFDRGDLTIFNGYRHLQREVSFAEGQSRADALLSGHSSQPDCLVEIKSVTLAMANGQGYFPDAKSDRAVKHINHLKEQVNQGLRAALVFVIQHAGINRLAPAEHIHMAYAQALKLGVESGLEVYALKAELFDGEYRITKKTIGIN